MRQNNLLNYQPAEINPNSQSLEDIDLFAHKEDPQINDPQVDFTTTGTSEMPLAHPPDDDLSTRRDYFSDDFQLEMNIDSNVFEAVELDLLSTVQCPEGSS